MFKYILLILMTVFSMTGCSQKPNSIINEMGISVKDTSRAFSFTNKNYGQYYGETNSYFADGWQGWTLRENRIFNDYELLVNKEELDRKTSTAVVFPHLLKRDYKSGIKEQFFFADSLDLIYVCFDGVKGETLSFIVDGINTDELPVVNNNIVKLGIESLVKGRSLYVYCNEKIEKAEKVNNKLSLSVSSSKKIEFVICVDLNNADIKTYADLIPSLIVSKEKRIQKLLEENVVKTSDEDFNKAFLWAIASVDALITEQDSKGIFAGLPWFNNNWGRDTFISLPGATFVIGNFKDAKEILLAFAKFQDANPNSPNYGRIPNRVTLTESIYNTTDGTPWFVIQAFNYYKYSNDAAFLKSIYPAVKLAFEGAVKNYVDDKGFLTHKDAETWMDAVGPNGPWSPRGNRANDIQALWFQQLKYSSRIGFLLGDTVFSKQCDAVSDKLKSNFEIAFVDKKNSLINDRLKPDGTPDKTIRPNLFFVLNEESLIPSINDRLKILTNAMKELVFPEGVLSLSQNDDNFHPYHQYPPYYVKDAAYHNGIIWTWNSGPVIQTLCNFGLQEKAWPLTQELTKQILTRGAVGSLAELNDALPRPGEKERRLSGTFSQAWSLGEYIRNFYQDYLGVKPDAPNKTLYLIPSLPAALKNVEFFQTVGSDRLKISYNSTREVCKITVKAISVADSLDLGVALMNKANASFQFKTSIIKNQEVEIQVPSYSTSLKDLVVKKDNSVIPVRAQLYVDPNENQELYEKIQFASPNLRSNLKALKGPDYKLLPNSEIKKNNSAAKTMYSVDDAEKDELYQYPTNVNFAKGILDITKFTLKEDDEYFYFTLKYKNLVNPGWHNEYGFQLTYTSICISNESGGKTRNVEANSNYVLDADMAYSKIINIGGGFEIKDATGKILAAYLPQGEDIKNPLGSISTKEVSFAIPKKYIGKIDAKTKLSILTGAQNDAGGAGIGTFRDVNEKASEWSGGGKKNPKDHNIYDFLFIN